MAKKQERYISLMYANALHYRVVCRTCDGTGYIDLPKGNGYTVCPSCTFGIEELYERDHKYTQVCPKCHRVLEYSKFIVWHTGNDSGQYIPYCKHCNKLELAYWSNAEEIVKAYETGKKSITL